MLPAHSRDLPAAYSGLDGPGDDRADLAAVGLGGRKKSSLFVAPKAPVAAGG
ncbi:MAG: hypothetical protein ACYCXX_15590 [Acidiferrobacter thiooxydans]